MVNGGGKSDALFKVVEVPVALSRTNAKGNRKQMDEDEDVFGDVDMVLAGETESGSGRDGSRRRCGLLIKV